MKAYVYVVFGQNGLPCYVGKGTGWRWKRRWQSLPVVKVREGLTDTEAYEIEDALIRAIGLENLLNRGYGGHGGPTGVKHSAEWRAHRSKMAAAVWQRPDYRAKVLRPDRDRSGNTQPRTEAFKAAVAAKMKGNTHTPRGFKHSEQARKNMGARRGSKQSAEHVTKRMLAMAETKRANLLDFMSGS